MAHLFWSGSLADRAEGEPLVSQQRYQAQGGVDGVAPVGARVLVVTIVHHDDVATGPANRRTNRSGAGARNQSQSQSHQPHPISVWSISASPAYI